MTFRSGSAQTRRCSARSTRGLNAGNGQGKRTVSFRCECAQLGCNELIELSVREYESVRSNPRRFIVLPGHERVDVETVIDRHPGYLVVEKLDQAGEKAAEQDPRG